MDGREEIFETEPSEFSLKCDSEVVSSEDYFTWVL
jgi:hypothetical protein